MVEPWVQGSVLQLAVGLALVFLAGFTSTRVLIGKRDAIETLFFTILLGLILPGLLIFVLNFFLGTKMDFVVVAGCFLVVALVGFIVNFRKSSGKAGA